MHGGRMPPSKKTKRFSCLSAENAIFLRCHNAIVAQLVEHWLPKPRVAGSSPVYRSYLKIRGLGCCEAPYFWFVQHERILRGVSP